jgi:hypothetical protein
MKRIAYFLSFVLAFIFLSTGLVYSQNNAITRKEKRNLEHMRKKKNRKVDLSVSRAYYSNLLQKKYFVFTADFAVNKEGISFAVNPELNFVSVVGDTVTFQFGRNGRIGWNGVGGITAHGTLVNYKFNPGKKNRGMNVSSGARMVGPGLPPNFSLYVSDDGTSQLIINFGSGGRVTLSGRIYSPGNSGIYEGQSVF